MVFKKPIHPMAQPSEKALRKSYHKHLLNLKKTASAGSMMPKVAIAVRPRIPKRHGIAALFQKTHRLHQNDGLLVIQLERLGKFSSLE